MYEKPKVGITGKVVLPEKRSQAGSGGGVGEVRFEMVGCVYCGALVMAGESAGGPYPFGVGGWERPILRWDEPDREEKVPLGVGIGAEMSEDAEGVCCVDDRLEVGRALGGG